MKKRRPSGFWKNPVNQKEFLDGLLKKFKIQPHGLTYSMVKQNGGRGLHHYYDNMLELIQAHYGEICLMDMGKVPQGLWDQKKYRVMAVHQAVERLGKAPKDIRWEDFELIGLGGLMTAVGGTHRDLLKEAGYKLPDLVSWKTRKARVKKVRELVKRAGGPHRLTAAFVEDHAGGLVNEYMEIYGRRKQRGYAPLLYFILTEAGYKVTPEGCIRGMKGARFTVSMHGHWNHSMPEALIDDWVHDIVGKAHLHDVIYPGQEHKVMSKRLNCDFVLFPPGQGLSRRGLSRPSSLTSPPGSPIPAPSIANQKSKIENQRGLWLEYAGLARTTSKPSQYYYGKLREKKALARKAGISLVVIEEKTMRKNPRAIWNKIVAKASWLKPRKKAALSSRFFAHFTSSLPSASLPSSIANQKLTVPAVGEGKASGSKIENSVIPYVPVRSKYTREALVAALKKRIRAGKSLVQTHCLRDKAFQRFYYKMERLSLNKYGRPVPRDWWEEWLIAAGMPRGKG